MQKRSGIREGGGKVGTGAAAKWEVGNSGRNKHILRNWILGGNGTILSSSWFISLLILVML